MAAVEFPPPMPEEESRWAWEDQLADQAPADLGGAWLSDDDRIDYLISLGARGVR